MTIRRITTVVTVTAGLTVFGGAATVPAVHAEPDDQQFIDEVAALEIPFGPDEDLPQVGKSVCEALTSGLAGNANPVPIVRGLVQQLENSGMNREQAVGLMRISVSAYCPEHARFMGR